MKCRILIILVSFLVVPSVYSQQQNKIDYKNQSYDLVFDSPNSILSVIPLESLPKVKSLTIRGELGKDDVSIIFDKCTDLEYLDLKNTSLTVFDIRDFSKVSRLRVFKMPNRIKRLQVSVRGENNIFGDLFKDCLYLEEVELPSDLEYLKCNLFVNCPKIKSVTIPAKVKELVSIIKNCRSLTTVDLSHCSKIENNSMGWRTFSWGVRNCPNIKTVKYQSGKQKKFYENGEPAGTCFYFSPNKCTVAYYENCTLFFKGEANNDKDNPTRNCVIYCPKSMMTHFYVEFNGFNNEIIGMTEAEMDKAQEIEQRRREQARQEQKKSENDRLERERKEAEKRQRVADSIARVEAHLNNLKASYSSCRFLFTTDAAFVSCITQESPIAIENGIMSLMDKKMEEISKAIVKGTEFKDQYYVRNSMEGICSIPDNMKYVDASIAEYAENKIQDFVNDRKVLSKAYDKAKKKDPNLKCSEFLTTYVNDINKSKNDNRKSSIKSTNNLFFAMANLAYSNAPQYSIGLTVGSVRKLGWYVSLNSDISSMANNFKYNNADYECDYSGTINELTSDYSYSGNKRSSRLGATADMMFSISGPVYAYAGGGYGFRNVFWELENGKWAKCTDDSYQGVAIDAGLVMHFGNFGISLGAQTIGVKYIEAKIGIGLAFTNNKKDKL